MRGLMTTISHSLISGATAAKGHAVSPGLLIILYAFGLKKLAS
jgi:hypothetical protein